MKLLIFIPLYLCFSLLGCDQQNTVVMDSGGSSTSYDAPSVIENKKSHRNVILIIGDGMDDNIITIARNYLVGARGELVLDTLPQRSAVQVITVSEDNPEQVFYVADSANSATAMATGVETSRGRIATKANSDQDITTIVQLAENKGLKTGIVTTASVTDATPASFVAHIKQRGCQGPSEMIGSTGFGGYTNDCSSDLKANGGKGSIAEQIAASDVDLLLGGGLKYFQQPAEGREEGITVLSLAKENGFSTLFEIEALNDESYKGKVMGLFSKSTMAVRLIGERDRTSELVTNNGMGDTVWPAPFSCEENPAFAIVPSLPRMTEFALSHLSQDNSQGFFLMVESASIDKQAHFRNPCGHIGEVKQLDEAVQVALDFIKENPETMLLVTADHGQAAQLIPQQSLFRSFLLSIHSPGYMARIKTPEGAVMGVNYATNNSSIMAEHTGVQVPLYAAGAGISEIPAYMQQSDIFSIMARHLDL
ncbi:alkaline phosphatase [Porticoccaceae bacterium]|nr:alkaline phosphatase [Porticoccaceae bacterium]